MVICWITFIIVIFSSIRFETLLLFEITGATRLQ